MASPDAMKVLECHPHRTPLSAEQIRALSNTLVALRAALGPDKAVRTSVYAAILRILKAHVSPLPNASVTFAQVQAARLQRLAERLVAERRDFPPELSAAVAQGLVSGFDARTGLRVPPEQQRAQLAAQQIRERDAIVRERARLHQLQQDFQRSRNGVLRRPEQGHHSDAHVEDVVPWEERRLYVQPEAGAARGYVMMDKATLKAERFRSLQIRTESAKKHIAEAFREADNRNMPMDARTAAFLETRLRHINLLQLQRQMRLKIWNERQLAERDGKRSSKGRARTLKQLQREFEKVERARLRQLESEERDARRKRQAWVNAMSDHINKFRGHHRDVVKRGVRAMTKAVIKYHEEVARNTNRAEREAEKARIQALRDDDEEGYLELVRKTKNTRLLELLDQTDKYLKELGAVVKEERVKSGVVEYGDHGTEQDGPRQSYYEIAHAIKESVDSQSSLLVGGTLKEYQLHGIQWMVSLYNNRLNGILADEMGLGKTIQTLGLIAHLMERKDNPGPYLIIVPLSTISNWELEFARWAPAIRVVVFKGDAKARKKLYEDVIEKKSFNVCLVTYEYVVRGKSFLRRVEWQHLIIDEGHRIKNHESRLSAVLHDHYRSRNRLLLTGTPLQNSLTELWALLNFLLPNVFKSAESFESWFAAPFAQMGVGNVPASEQQAQLTEEESLLIIRRLHQVMRPFLLRRMKDDVLRMGEQLPDKQEHVLLCEMSSWQRYMYLKIVKADRVLFTDRHGRQRFDKLSNPAVQLRKCVNHPYLFFQDHASRLIDTSELWRASGKFDMLDSIITKLLRTGHRILIFNQMTKVVDLQERLLRYRNVPFYRLDGSTNTDDRKAMVNDFNDDASDVNVFLLTTRAGGLGVNLQTADTVIIFDSDWNPSMDQQAQDRAHRIGQRREVLVLRMITAKSIEEDVMERASFKRGLEKKIIRAGMFDERSKDSERQAMLRELLRVEGPVSDEEQEDGLPTEEEINRLLARSEDEFGVFTKIDEERALEILPRQGLIADNEIPEWAVKVPRALREKAKSSGAGNWSSAQTTFDITLLNEPKKRRAATTNVNYNLDQLSERQYIKLMERSEAGEDVSQDAIRLINKPKRRRKDKAPEASTCEAEDPDYNKPEDSHLDVSDAGTDAAGSRRLSASPTSEVMVGSKTLNGDLKSYDDDATEGGNVTGGEQSYVPSGADDMMIDDDDDDEDGEADDEHELGAEKQPAVKRVTERRRSRSQDVGSDTSEEGEIDVTSRGTSTNVKSPGRVGLKEGQGERHQATGESKNRLSKPLSAAEKRRINVLDVVERDQSESSGDSDIPLLSRHARGRGRAARTKPTQRKVSGSDGEEAGAGSIDEDGASTESEKSPPVLESRIPRRKLSKAAPPSRREKPALSHPSVRADLSSGSGEIERDKETDEEEEDGEIREEGELSDEGARNAAKTRVNGTVISAPRGPPTGPQGAPRLPAGVSAMQTGHHSIPTGAPRMPMKLVPLPNVSRRESNYPVLSHQPLQNVGIAQRQAIPRIIPPVNYVGGPAKSKYQASWLTGMYAKGKGGQVNAQTGSSGKSLPYTGRNGTATITPNQPGVSPPPSFTTPVTGEGSEEDGEIGEEGEIVEDS